MNISLVSKVLVIAVAFATAPPLSAQGSDPQLDTLRREQFCTRAAAEFMAKPEWKPENQVGDSVGHTSHYSTRDRRCYVQVTRTLFSAKSKQITEMNHIYDALGGQVIGGRHFIKSTTTTPPTVTGVLVYRGTTQIQDKTEAIATLRWYEQLMVD